MKTNLDWNKFKLFYYVAKIGSFTGAAERLNMSQPSLSRSIQDLEYQLKTSLFERVARGIVITKQGNTLLEAVEKAFEEFTSAEIKMFEEDKEPQGTLKVATTLNLSPGWLIPHIVDFLRLYPKIQLTIIASDEELDIKTGIADVSIRPFVENKPGLIQEFIHYFNLKLFASQAYLNEHGIPKKPKDLDHHKLIVFGFEASSPYADINWPLKLGRPRESLRTPYLCINCSVGMLQAAEEDLGIAALVEGYAEISKTKLIEVLPDVKKPSIPIYYVYPKHLKESMKVQAFGEYLKRIFNTPSIAPESFDTNVLAYKKR